MQCFQAGFKLCCSTSLWLYTRPDSHIFMARLPSMAALPDVLPISLNHQNSPVQFPCPPQTPGSLSSTARVLSQHLYEDSTVKHKEEVLGIHASLSLPSQSPLPVGGDCQWKHISDLPPFLPPPRY